MRKIIAERLTGNRDDLVIEWRYGSHKHNFDAVLAGLRSDRCDTALQFWDNGR